MAEKVDPVTGEVLEGPAAEIARQQDVGERPQSFAVLLATLEKGDLNQDLTTRLARLVRDMTELHNEFPGMAKIKGELEIKLALTMGGGTVKIAAAVKVKSPGAPRGDTQFWPTKAGGLARSDPNQIEMFGTVKS